jgi:hypothetical protein
MISSKVDVKAGLGEMMIVDIDENLKLRNHQ